ncbi:response regulator transcription factor [Ideonella paludis]|uniref:Response regulator transcription factor n=1 Tax=Ideonella paludis TaxID=1233411 RepID=A0ABS5DUC4_9BURK|nr:response regulator transcription factor [Ideonella paludis]MBQ0934743.1 response regulator transcription factor [Ideonella paludis]
MKVLLIEDDTALQATLQRTLERRGMRVTVCSDGLRALDRWQASLPDVVLLDLSLPGQDGLMVLSQARAQGLKTPVLIVTARGTIGDRIVGLNTGADDYLPKPFDLDELEARMRALARRAAGAIGSSPASPSSTAPMAFMGLSCDAESGAAYHHGQPLEMPPRELALLRALLQRPGHAVAKERLFSAVFPGERDVQPEAIEVVAYRLRKRLAGTQVQLVTLRGLGYLLRANA